MASNLILTDRWGNAVQRNEMTAEVGGPTLTGVRSPISGYPGDGLDPLRLAEILRAADHGDPVRYMELAETIEERDPHFLGVIGTRKRAVSQLDITVEAASEDAHDVALADMLRDWLKRDELQQEIFHILDCISKGFSGTEIIWDTSARQYMPMELKWRDPRIFRFNRTDLTTPMMIGDNGLEQRLPPFKFIFSDIPAKSGLPLRSGLSRVAMWGWMFKAYTARDWSIFTQTYGQPLRVGKWQPGASDKDKGTLFRAVANIAGDCAAIIPDTMSIDFIESKSIGASGDLYQNRINHLDQQISKAVLGQTATTDAISGGHAVSREHRLVQEDIETADAMALAAILNRDLVRPWIQLEHGPQKRYPRLKIGRAKTEDLDRLATAVDKMVRLGMEIEEGEVRGRFGFSQPKPGARLLQPRDASNPALGAPSPAPDNQTMPIEGQRPKIKGGAALSGTRTALQSEGALAAIYGGSEAVTQLTGQLEAEAAPAVEGMVDQLEAMLAAASSLDEFREMIMTGFSKVDSSTLASIMALAIETADLRGSADAAQDGRDG